MSDSMLDQIYNRKGKLISLEEWATVISDPSYKIIAQSYTPDGKYWISTVWLGADHNFGHPLAGGGTHIPLIFETMVFPNDSWDDLYCERYATEEEARRGHEKAIKSFTAKEAAEK